METILAIHLIGANPTVRNGRPYILGTTITVADIAVARVFWRMDADEIADYYDLQLPSVYAALAYYYDHKAAIDASLHSRRTLAEQMKEQRVGSRHPPLFG